MAGASEPPLPRDADHVAAILRSMGVKQYEPRVLHQLLEFMHRYCTEVFQDGASYAEHSGRAGSIECEDVQLAVRLKEAASQTSAPELIAMLAHFRNQEPLPEQPQARITLPKENLCLLHPNYQLEPSDLALESFHQQASDAPGTGVTTIPVQPHSRVTSAQNLGPARCSAETRNLIAPGIADEDNTVEVRKSTSMDVVDADDVWE
mmetsp:Transcript_72689/g.161530  ORF Transcript_72689/g.161530 Transcript_72689/m.161530 type:complete len:206 (-) Transcript_72689:148-765(-)